MRRALCLAIISGLLLAGAACAELPQSCQVESIDVQTVTNAVIIKLTCNGLVEFGPDWMTMWETTADGGFQLKNTESFTVNLNNVTSGAASMVNVAQYPVSHLTFQPIPGAAQNIGLRCSVVLYRPGYVTVFNGKGGQWDQQRWYRYRTDVPRTAITVSTDQKTILITVLSNRPTEPEPVRPKVHEATPQLAVVGDREHLTVRALHSDLSEVLRQLSERAEVPIFVDEPLPDRVTAQFTDRTLPQVLGALADGYGFCVSEANGAYYVTQSKPETPASYWASVTRTVPLRYLAPAKALLLLPEVALPYVHSNPDGNALVLDGPRPLVDRLERDLAVLDQPARHCRLRAWVVSTEDSGNETREVLARLTGGTTSGLLASTGQLTVSVGQEQATTALSQLSGLATSRHLQLEALPTVVCQPGQTARLFVGQQVYYLRMYGWYAEVRLGKVSVGSELVITPRNVGDSITAAVSVTNSFAGAQTAAGPTIFRRSANANLRMASGQLMVIGGLRADDATNHRDQPVPWLDPLAEVVSGRLKAKTRGEVTVLVQADTTADAPLVKKDEVPQ